MVIRGTGLSVVEVPFMVISRVYRSNMKVFKTVSNLFYYLNTVYHAPFQEKYYF